MDARAWFVSAADRAAAVPSADADQTAAGLPEPGPACPAVPAGPAAYERAAREAGAVRRAFPALSVAAAVDSRGAVRLCRDAAHLACLLLVSPDGRTPGVALRAAGQCAAGRPADASRASADAPAAVSSQAPRCAAGSSAARTGPPLPAAGAVLTRRPQAVCPAPVRARVLRSRAAQRPAAAPRSQPRRAACPARLPRPVPELPAAVAARTAPPRLVPRRQRPVPRAALRAVRLPPASPREQRA